MLKFIKAAVATAMVAAVAAGFFGGRYAAIACKIQPAATWYFAAVLALTLVFGRFFCEMLCPLGILQSFVNFIFHRRTKVRRVCTRLPDTPAQRAVRYTVLAVFAALIALGYGALAWSLTPYSIFGKALTLFYPGLALFAAVLVLAAFGKGRIWCNWVCPAGTVFNLLARFSFFKNNIQKGCGNCQRCFGKEKAEAARQRAKEHHQGFTRRETLHGMAVLAATAAAEKTTDGGYAPVSLPGVPEREKPVLPPGALAREFFNAKCVGCGLCEKVCPGHAIVPSLSLKRFGQPELSFSKGYCLTACNYRCAEVCPAGALVKPEGTSRKDIHMGRAVWNRQLCLRTDKVASCTACLRKCPVKAIHLVEGFPVVDAEVCIGCGACEHVCPVRPLPAMTVEGFDRQVKFKPIDDADLLTEMRSLIAEGAAVVTAKNKVITAQAKGHGVKPLLKLLDEGRLAGAVVFDKVIGRAAAAICVSGGAAEVHTLVASEGGVKYLADRGIAITADKVVREIFNRDKTGRCPMESRVEKLESPAEIVEALRK